MYITDGPGAGQWRTITAYQGPSHRATLDAPWDTGAKPDLSSAYAVARAPFLHFLGHGSGAAVTSAAVERLGALGVPVDQVTYLDPHDFVQAGLPDILTQQSALGLPLGYGAAVWKNVAFTDVYYQSRGLNGETSRTP